MTGRDGTVACLRLQNLCTGADDMERQKQDVAKLAYASDPARIRPDQRARYEHYLSEILGALGLPLDRDGTRGTPARLLQAWIDATSGYEPDPKLVTVFPIDDLRENGGDYAQVVEGPIPFTALCEHHVLPFFGRAWIGYVASDRVIGLSKLTRLLRQYSRRFTMQERIGSEVARALHTIVGARGTAVRIEAAHLCTRMRGVREADTFTSTTAWRGHYEASESLRREFFELCRGS